MLSMLLALLIILLLFTTKKCGCGREKAYIEQLMTAKDKARDVSIDAKINTIRTALDSYYLDKGEYPGILDELVPYYIRVTGDITDPWGKTLKLETDDRMNLVLVSAGKDGFFGNSDDIRRRI